MLTPRATGPILSQVAAKPRSFENVAGLTERTAPQPVPNKTEIILNISASTTLRLEKETNKAHNKSKKSGKTRSSFSIN